MSIRQAVEWLKNRGFVKESTAQKADADSASNTSKCYPLAGEKESVFMSRCMDHMMNGRGKDHEQSLGACLGIWGEHGTIKKGTKQK